MPSEHQGSCFCGAVRIAVSGVPAGMGYCHCESCRSWSGAPVSAYSLWAHKSVRVIAGKEHVATYFKTTNSERQYCRKCGGHLMMRHPGLKLTNVFAATLPSLDFRPGAHLNYAQTVLPMKDGLPKFMDFPTAFGGAGRIIGE